MLRDVLTALESHRLVPKGEGRWIARCPSHEDSTPSLSVTRGTGGRTLMTCFAGCKVEDVVGALGLEMTALFDGERNREARETLPPEKWPVTAMSVYETADGRPLFRVLRKTSPDSGKKTFRQERNVNGMWVSGMDGVERVLYRLPQLSDHETADDTVWIAEGERDVDALVSMGLVATTNAGGAGKWLPQYTAALKGRHVVILPDNDQPGEAHAKTVSEALAGVAASVKVLRLPGLPDKGDVSDWIGAGGTAEQLREMADRLSTGARFMPSPRRIEGERADRLELSHHVLSFGVRFLDEALGGITRRDLVLLGAKTGAGKTALATNIAMANCRAGRRVHYFALEAEDREIERRMKYELLATAYYRHAYAPKRIRFLDWYMGRLDGELGHFEERADAELSALLKNLNTYYRVDSFTTDDFSRHLAAIQDETDLVILDHFHYVDSEDQNENRGQKQIVKQIRDGVLRSGRPVVVVGHVRKSDTRYAPLIPTEEAFHGSSDLVKIATKAVMLAPDYETRLNDRSCWSTYMQVVKCRQDSSVTRYAARLTYDTRVNCYEGQYILGRLTDGGRGFEALPTYDVPDWAFGAMNAPGGMQGEAS